MLSPNAGLRLGVHRRQVLVLDRFHLARRRSQRSDEEIIPHSEHESSQNQPDDRSYLPIADPEPSSALAHEVRSSNRLSHAARLPPCVAAHACCSHLTANISPTTRQATPAFLRRDVDGGSMPQVPWGVGKIMQVMILWLLAYILIGQVSAQWPMSGHTGATSVILFF